MAQTSVFGINSGFDTAAVVDQLIELQSRPIDINLAKRDAQVEKLTTFQDLKSRLQTFKTTLLSLNTESRFVATEGKFTPTGLTTNSDLVSVSTTSTATSGSFTLEVTQLAREAKVTSGGFESIASTVQPGTLEIKVGGKTTLVNINTTNNTLDGLRLAINNSGAGVTANFVDDGSGTNSVRLVLSGTQTGAANSISARIFSSGLAGEITTMSFTETQTAQDAILNLDGINITKSSNTVTDIINGAILTLNGEGTGKINISTDLDAIRTKVTNFVNGYNDLNEFIRSQLSFDPDTFETGLLFGNFAVQNLQNTLRSVTSGQVEGASGQFQFLSQVGITTQSDGNLVLETSELNDALQADIGNVTELFSSLATVTNPNVTFIGFTQNTEPGTFEIRVQGGKPQIRKSGEANFVDAVGSGNFFAGPEGSSSEGLNFRIGTFVDGNYGTINMSIGVSELLNREITFLADGNQDGPLTTEINTITSTIDDLDQTLLDLDTRLAEFERNLRDRFTNLEIILGRLNTQKESFASSIANIQSIFGSGGAKG